MPNKESLILNQTSCTIAARIIIILNNLSHCRSRGVTVTLVVLISTGVITEVTHLKRVDC